MSYLRRYITFFTSNENRIDIYNSLFGRKYIYCDGKLVSKKFSMLGSTHSFVINAAKHKNNYLINIKVKWPYNIGLEIFENGKAIILS